MKMMHVTIQTKNFEEEIRFYQEIIGLSIQRELKGEGRHIVFLGSGDGSPSIEIIHNPDANDCGNRHLSIGFKTADAEKTRETLIEKGYKVSEMISPMPQVQFFFVRDPAGVTVQLM